jgi:hypothetical protein
MYLERQNVSSSLFRGLWFIKGLLSCASQRSVEQQAVRAG